MAVKPRTLVFQYKRGRSFLHRIPALPKLAALLSLTITIMFLPAYAICVSIGIMAGIAFLCGFTIREQFTDIRPALLYAVFLYLISMVSVLLSLGGTAFTYSHLKMLLYPNYDYLRYVLRLFLIMQLSALLFRTTTSIETKEAICAIEKAVLSTVKKLSPCKNISLKTKI